MSRADHLAKILRDLVRELLGRIVTDDSPSFLELGLDTPLLTQGSQTFRSRFGSKVTVRNLLQTTPTVRLLAIHLDQQLPSDASRPGVDKAQPPAPAPVCPFLVDSSAVINFIATKRGVDSIEAGLSSAQRASLSQLIERYTRTAAKFRALIQQYRQW